MYTLHYIPRLESGLHEIDPSKSKVIHWTTLDDIRKQLQYDDIKFMSDDDNTTTDIYKYPCNEKTLKEYEWYVCISPYSWLLGPDLKLLIAKSIDELVEMAYNDYLET